MQKDGGEQKDRGKWDDASVRVQNCCHVVDLVQGSNGQHGESS